MNTDQACEILSDMSRERNEILITGDIGDACDFAIYRMRELDSMQKMLRSIVAEFKEQT